MSIKSVYILLSIAKSSKKKKKQNVSDPQNVAASLRKGKAYHHRQ